MDKVKDKALTFDDVLLVPAYSDFLPSQASLKTSLTKNIEINLPLVSAAMDTVTEYRMAIALAEAGGIGILHKNCSIKEQMNAVRNVKKYESGVVRDPTTINSNKTIGQLKQLTDELNVSGMPVVDDGVVKGIVTSRDFRYADNMDDLVSSIMTPREKLITVSEDTSQDVVKKLMYENRIEKVLVLNGEELTGLVTMKDIEKSKKHPNATKDESTPPERPKRTFSPLVALIISSTRLVIKSSSFQSGLHKQISKIKLSKINLPPSVWVTSGWNCRANIESEECSIAAIGADLVEAVNLNSVGRLSTLSP